MFYEKPDFYASYREWNEKLYVLGTLPHERYQREKALRRALPSQYPLGLLRGTFFYLSVVAGVAGAVIVIAVALTAVIAACGASTIGGTLGYLSFAAAFAVAFGALVVMGGLMCWQGWHELRVGLARSVDSVSVITNRDIRWRMLNQEFRERREMLPNLVQLNVSNGIEWILSVNGDLLCAVKSTIDEYLLATADITELLNDDATGLSWDAQKKLEQRLLTMAGYALESMEIAAGPALTHRRFEEIDRAVAIEGETAKKTFIEQLNVDRALESTRYFLK